MAESAEFKFDSKEWQEFIKKLNKKLTGASSSREFAGIISSSVYSDIMDHFSKEQGPDGKWDAWSEVYKKHLQKVGRGGNKILQFSGKLRQSMTPQNWRSVPGGVLFFNNAQTKTGFPYAYAHDNDEGSRSKLPRRAFMWLSDNGMEKIIGITEKWMSEG